MGELKKIRVRNAKASDHGLFRKLWMGLLEQQVKEGSIVGATDATLAFYERLFNSYINSDFDGIVLFVADRGVLMWGASGTHVSYPGKTATAWGAYIAPETSEAVRDAMVAEADKWALKNEFVGLLMQTYEKTEKPEGFEPAATVWHRTLNG